MAIGGDCCCDIRSAADAEKGRSGPTSQTSSSPVDVVRGSSPASQNHDDPYCYTMESFAAQLVRCMKATAAEQEAKKTQAGTMFNMSTIVDDNASLGAPATTVTNTALSASATVYTLLATDTIDAKILSQLEELEAKFSQEMKNDIVIPACVKAFLSRPLLRQSCFSHLAFNPLVVGDYSEDSQRLSIDCGEGPLFVHSSPTNANDNNSNDSKVGLRFMGDHQGCCYWYAVWDPTPHTTSSAPDMTPKASASAKCGPKTSSSSSSDVSVDGNDASSVSVYVLFGGQPFNLQETAFLTSRNFWRFLHDYAKGTADRYI